MNGSAKDGLTFAPVKTQSAVSICGGAASILKTVGSVAQYVIVANFAHAATTQLKNKNALGW